MTGRWDWASGLVGAISEAWTELRVNKTRVLMSLIGVAAAVAALTTVVALGGVLRQTSVEQMEAQGGRPASLQVNIGSDTVDPLTGMSVIDSDAADAAFLELADRYGIDFRTRVSSVQLGFDTPRGTLAVYAQAVDQPFGEMRRVAVEAGRWFTTADADRLAPAVIVNEVLWTKLGSPDLATNPGVTLRAGAPLSAVIVGVTPSTDADFEYDQFTAYVLADTYDAFDLPVDPNRWHDYYYWVPPELSAEFESRIRTDLQGVLGEGSRVDVYRSDWANPMNTDPFIIMQLAISAIALVVMLLGALSLVNITLVTVRYRIREIGIRRSFGATAGRIFFSVMMESVVATFTAGVVGVIFAVLLIQNPWVQERIAGGLDDIPPFPIEAALIGLAASLLVGALAGLLPAFVAVRVKVIDAIRF